MPSTPKERSDLNDHRVALRKGVLHTGLLLPSLDFLEGEPSIAVGIKLANHLV
eukprot:UN4716